MRDDSSLIGLVTRARAGDKGAWDALVDRFAPLVRSICRRYHLSSADAEDVGQSVWLRLVEQLDNLREPAALAGWLATTTQRECCRVLRERGPQGTGPVPDMDCIPDGQAVMAEQELLIAERHAAFRQALTRLPQQYQRLLALLTEDPPVPYAKISATLGTPIGSIGPIRGRCLDLLRRDPVIAALINADYGTPRYFSTDEEPDPAGTSRSGRGGGRDRGSRGRRGARPPARTRVPSWRQATGWTGP